MLPTDWSAPGASALGRLSDRRVQQFWDPNHLMAAVLKKAEVSGKLHPKCCDRNGFLWDLTAAYAPGKLWGDAPPEPILLNGPVVKNTAELESLVASANSRAE
jgi:hypothetical protein